MSLALVASLSALAMTVQIESARSSGGASEWQTWPVRGWTNVPESNVRFHLVKGVSRIPRPAHVFGLWMPRNEPPSGRAMATIYRNIGNVEEAPEGDFVTIDFFGEPIEKGLHPGPTIVVYVLCHTPAPGETLPQRNGEWVKIGQANVKPTYKLQTLKAKIQGGECSGVVALGKSRGVYAVRIQLLGASNPHDHLHRDVYLTRFEIVNGTGATQLEDDFTQP